MKIHILIIAIGLLALAAVLTLSGISSGEVGDHLTRNTVRLSLAWYAAALLSMLQLRSQDWPATTLAGQLTRWFWTWGLIVFVVHVGMAMHFFDHWSHAASIERTRIVSGVGEGVYVSYLFVVLWAADVATWWIVPARYAARSPWIDRTLHGFMLLMVFNGMIVFETGPIRYAGILLFTVLTIAGWLYWQRNENSQRANQPA